MSICGDKLKAKHQLSVLRARSACINVARGVVDCVSWSWSRHEKIASNGNSPYEGRGLHQYAPAVCAKVACCSNLSPVPCCIFYTICLHSHCSCALYPGYGHQSRRSEEARSSKQPSKSKKTAVSQEVLEATPQLNEAKRKLQSLSYGTKGQDPSKLFAQYDRDNNGILDFKEFVAAVRKGGKLTAMTLSDDGLRMIFDAVDVDGNGVLSIAELTSFVWAGEPSKTATPERGSRAATSSRRRSQPQPQPARVVAAQDYGKHTVEFNSGSETEDD